MKITMNPRLMLIASMTIFGTLGIFVRNIPVSSGELALYRAVLAALLIAVFLLLTKQQIPFSKIKKEVPLLLASGIAMGINWILLFEAYKYTTVSVATLSYYLRLSSSQLYVLFFSRKNSLENRLSALLCQRSDLC